jgi:hypothetical protein
MPLKLISTWRFGVTCNSVTALLRRRRLRSITAGGISPSTRPTAALMGPPLETISTSPSWQVRTWSSASATPATKSA